MAGWSWTIQMEGLALSEQTQFRRPLPHTHTHTEALFRFTDHTVGYSTGSLTSITPNLATHTIPVQSLRPETAQKLLVTWPLETERHVSTIQQAVFAFEINCFGSRIVLWQAHNLMSLGKRTYSWQKLDKTQNSVCILHAFQPPLGALNTVHP